MANRGKGEGQGRQQPNLSQLIGNPAYFFDTKFLQAEVSHIAGWSQTRLEAALTPRFDHALTPEDLRIPSREGFYVVFADPNTHVARDKAKAICADIMRHFFGEDAPEQGEFGKLCRSSSVITIADELSQPIDVAAAIHSGSSEEKGRVAHTEEPSENENEKLQFRRELLELYQASFEGTAQDDFGFAPCWDSKQQRITSFACTLNDAIDGPAAESAGIDIPVATAQCKHDVRTLAGAAKGVHHLISRGDVAAISTAVHIGTMSWSKTRNGYFDALAQIEPRIRALIAPRIMGLEAGSNLSTIAAWTSAMRRFVPWNFLHLPSLNLDLSRAGMLGVRGIGASMGALPAKGLAAGAEKLKRIASSQNAIAYVYEVASLEELAVLNARGIRVIAGPVIGPPSPLPGPVKPLSFEMEPAG